MNQQTAQRSEEIHGQTMSPEEEIRKLKGQLGKRTKDLATLRDELTNLPQLLRNTARECAAFGVPGQALRKTLERRADGIDKVLKEL